VTEELNNCMINVAIVWHHQFATRPSTLCLRVSNGQHRISNGQSAALFPSHGAWYLARWRCVDDSWMCVLF